MNRLFVLLQVGLVLLLIQASPIFLSAQSTAGLCKGNLGANIFPRGEFGSGTANVLPYDPKLAPSYIYQSSPPPNDGYYTITNGTHNWGSFARDTWIKIGDNSNDP